MDSRVTEVTEAMTAGIRQHLATYNFSTETEIALGHYFESHKFDLPISPFSHRVKRFKVYCPAIFDRLRSEFWPFTTSFVDSLKIDANSAGESEGKSGATFYKSEDGLLVFKTVTDAETQFLLRILPIYYKHILENKDTLIVPIFGLFRIQFQLGKCIHFIAMKNLFPSDMRLKVCFDIKGSQVGRKGEDTTGNKRIILKDVEFASDHPICTDSSERQILLETIKKDANFLASIRSMDYSLLIGIYSPKDHEFNEIISLLPNSVTGDSLHNHFGGMRAVDNNGRKLPTIYFLGIIDYLQEYTPAKELEHEVKSLLYDPMSVSCVPPHDYAGRFISFLDKSTA